jgi:glutamyl-tRNA reductase
MIGINHDTAPVEMRERLVFDRPACDGALQELLARPDVAEAMLLSTCNRTELYARQAEDAGPLPAFADNLLRELIRIGDAEGLDTALFQTRLNEDAVRHLYRVASGLESMVKGEGQILGQVRDAYRSACEADGCAVILHKLLHAAFRVGKRARAATDIGVGAVSVGLAAVQRVQEAFAELHDRSVLVVGAGEIASLVASHLVCRGASLVVVNRTEARARDLAGKWGGRAVPFEQLADAIAGADAVITSAASAEYLVTREMVIDMDGRRPELMVDLAVPRNIDPAIADVEGVSVCDIDGLRTIVDGNLDRRAASVPQVEGLINSEVEAFGRWHKSLGIVPAIQDLVSVVDTIRRTEIERVAKHFSPEQLEHVDKLTRSIVKKILHHPITDLRENHANGGEGAE